MLDFDDFIIVLKRNIFIVKRFSLRMVFYIFNGNLEEVFYKIYIIFFKFREIWFVIW